MNISIVLPIYQEKDNLCHLLDEIEEVFKAQSYEFEVIAVDDGSTDGTVALLRQEAKRRSYLKVILLRKNF